MNCLIVGGSGSLGLALAEELASCGHAIFLVASDSRDLAPICEDLRLRFSIVAAFEEADLRDFDPAKLRRAVHTSIGSVDWLFLASGYSSAQDGFPVLQKETKDLIEINCVGPMAIIAEFLPDLEKSANGNCVGIGSVAQARARKFNTVYGASKQALEFFFSGLRHHLGATPCRVQYYRLGYMKSRMTQGKSLLFPPAEPQEIARRIIAKLGRDRVGAYLPFWWGGIMLVYRALPWFLYRRLSIR